jgi:hypothetical protein
MQSVYNHTDTRQIMNVLNQVVSQFENTGSITLTTSTTTTVNNPKVTSLSRVILQPRNANAASSSHFISSISSGSFVIGHVAGAAGRILDYALYNL